MPTDDGCQQVPCTKFGENGRWVLFRYMLEELPRQSIITALKCISRRKSHEIPEEIFIRCLPANKFPTSSAYDAPPLLTQICKERRDFDYVNGHLDVPDRMAVTTIIRVVFQIRSARQLGHYAQRMANKMFREMSLSEVVDEGYCEHLIDTFVPFLPLWKRIDPRDV